MSVHAKQAVLAAAAESDELKSKLAADFESAVAEVLALTDSEKEELKSALAADDSAASEPTMEEEEGRDTPALAGPGVTGG